MTFPLDYRLLLVSFAVVVFVLLRSKCTAITQTAPYPPGPPELPLLGSVHLLPQKYQERTLAEWGKAFGLCLFMYDADEVFTDPIMLGDVVFAKLFQTPAIIISSYDTARELMEKRSGNYSDRPRFILIVEL